MSQEQITHHSPQTCLIARILRLKEATLTAKNLQVERKPSSAEKVRLSMVAPSWGHRKTSSADKANPPSNKRLSMVSPLSVDRPSSPFSAGRMQQLGRFEETGLRHSKVATPDEMMTLGNPAAIGYSCRIEGGTPKLTP